MLVILSAQVAWNHFAKFPESERLLPHQTLSDLFDRAVANWYLGVASGGYRYQVDPRTGTADGNLGNNPVFRLLVRMAHGVVSVWLTAGHLVANVTMLIACFLLWELAQRELGSPLAAG